MTTIDEARDRAAKAASIKDVRHTIGIATMELGRAVGKMTADPEAALAALDGAIGLLKASRDLFAATAGEV